MVTAEPIGEATNDDGRPLAAGAEPIGEATNRDGPAHRRGDQP